MPDITLKRKKDLLGLEDDLATTSGPQQNTWPDNEIQPEQCDSLHVNIEDAKDKDEESQSTYYIKEFPANLGAGAVWREDVSFFEKLRQQQKETVSL